MPRVAALPIVCLIFATWLVFWPVTRASFVQWDDPDLVYANAAMNPPTWAKTGKFWTAPVIKLYTPLAYTAWAAIAVVDGRDSTTAQTLSPVPFHLLNLLLHTAAAVLAFLLLNELIASTWAAWTGAMVFAVHPLQVEPVAWVSGMNNVLCGALCMAALWQYVIYAKSERPSSGRFAIATAFFALALLSKPTAVVLPLVGVVVDHLLLERPLRRSKPLLIWLAMAVVMAGAARLAQPEIAAQAPPVPQRVWVAIDAVGFDAAKLIAPLHLGIDYERSPRWLMRHSEAGCRGVLVLLLAAAACLYRRTKWLRAPLAIVVIALIPVLGLAPFDFQDYSTVADRYMYLPMLGVALAVGLAMHDARAGRIVVLILLALMGVRSFLQTRAWQDTPSLAAGQFEIDPDSSTGHKILAAWLAAHGRDGEAEQQFRAAIAALQGEGKVGDGAVWFDYGNLLRRQGRVGEAIEQYQKALGREPDDQRVKTFNNLGLAYYMAGDLNAAREQFHNAINLRPDDADARRNLARIGG